MGFFFQVGGPGEGAVAQRRAEVLDRAQRRREQNRQRRLWAGDGGGGTHSSPPRERSGAPSPPPPPPAVPDPPRAPAEGAPPPPPPPRRGAFTRQEHERRQQLKLMEELEKVLRPPRGNNPPRGHPPRGQPPRGTRPRCCDDSALAPGPPKGLLGPRLSKVYSQSTLSLSTVGNEPGGGTQPGGGAPSRAASPSGPVSPGRGPPGRERDWGDESSASSPASGPEYTGPRLYKEPSAKSNKPIIHNALAHCCLAGRANEAQKNRVLQEVEKSSATHFLILFRDGGCQFRALYALGGTPPALRRLAGAGPRTVPLPLVEATFKYHSDRRRFTRLPARTMSLSVDAFTIPGHLWAPRKGGAKKPAAPK